MTIKQLNEFGLTPEFVYEYKSEGHPLLDKYNIKVVDQLEISDDLSDILEESRYHAIEYYLVIECPGGEFYKATCNLSSYADDWSEWFAVTPKQKLVTYYE
jgi:hypothetical protein